MRHLFYSIIVLSVLGCSSIPPAQISSPDKVTGSAIVTDIDGTLTPDVYSIKEVRPDAAEAINAIFNKGYKVIYVTTRIPLFQSGLQKWLNDNGFPAGTLHVAQTDEERNHPDKYKARILKEYVHQGWQLSYAYGDSTTDFSAYGEVGIPKEKVFALKRRSSENCQDGSYQKCLTGWTEYLPYIDKEIPTVK